MQDGSANSLGLQLGALAAAQLQAAAEALARPGEKRHGGVHQARKALRRTRAILALGRGRLGAQQRTLSAQIGSLGRGLSVLRDAHALIETLQRLHGSEEDIAAVFAAAVAAATERRDRLLQRELIKDPELSRRRQRIHALRERLLRLSWSDVSEKTVRKAVGRSLQRIQAAHERTRAAHASAEDWHQLRRRLRRMRQQHSVVEELAPHLLDAFPEADERAERMGEAQDDALLLSRCGARSPFPVAVRHTLRAVARRRLAHSRAGH